MKPNLGETGMIVLSKFCGHEPPKEAILAPDDISIERNHRLRLKELASQNRIYFIAKKQNKITASHTNTGISTPDVGLPVSENPYMDADTDPDTNSDTDSNDESDNSYDSEEDSNIGNELV